MNREDKAARIMSVSDARVREDRNAYDYRQFPTAGNKLHFPGLTRCLRSRYPEVCSEGFPPCNFSPYKCTGSSVGDCRAKYKGERREKDR